MVLYLMALVCKNVDPKFGKKLFVWKLYCLEIQITQQPNFDKVLGIVLFYLCLFLLEIAALKLLLSPTEYYYFLP